MGSEPTGADALTLRVAQLALLARLVLLLLLTVLYTAQGRGGATAQVALVAAASYVLLRSRRVRAYLMRHPLAVLGDAALISLAIGAFGADSPFALALCTSALLVGLWLRLLPGVMVLSALLAFYLALLTARPLSVDGVTAYAVIMPALFVTLWWLGLVVQRAAAAEGAAQAALRDAIAAAATGQERGRIAREMHDTVAKTLQAMAMTAASVKATVHSRPEVAVARASELEEDATRVIDEVRRLMHELRREPEAVSFSELVAQSVEEWRGRTGGLVTVVAEPIHVTDSLVRYELLMCLGEALENVHRHAGRCKATVRLNALQDAVRLEVADTGVGASSEAVAQSAERGHFGVVGMRERMDQVGGTFHHETVPGEGTTVVFTVHRRGLVERQTREVRT